MRSRIVTALILLFTILFIGVVGFKSIMDLSWIDSLYMTVITITTVGYREVEIPNTEAKLFIVFLILSSVVIVGYAVSAITEYILSKNSLKDLRFKRKLKQIEAMENHIIICGYGRNGRMAAEKLQDYNRDFLIIEKDPEVIENATLPNRYFLKGNASDDDVLIKAGIENASTLISALPDDAGNLFIVLSARQLNKKLKIVSRASEESSYKKLKFAGANSVILPDKIGGEHMAALIVSPDLVEFWDNLSYGGSDGVNLEQVSFEQMFSTNETCSIIDLNLRKKTGCTIIGYKNPDGEYTVNPDPQLLLVPGSKIIVVGNPEQIHNLQDVYRITEDQT